MSEVMACCRAPPNQNMNDMPWGVQAPLQLQQLRHRRDCCSTGTRQDWLLFLGTAGQ
ncbi:unnamed protein product [Polarella glacialis]|uniref:Uncharacterized protein n=1 Tax=Polarella glacialis TaxID=89957 RepID=A0A813KPA2_POLGL|nr:unnamed protein product [Polarella glacialis]